MNRVLIYLSLSFLFPYLLTAQNKDRYEMKGHIEGLKEGEKIVMRLVDENVWNDSRTTFINRDSAYVRDGRFYMSGQVPGGPRLYFMKFSEHAKVCRMLIDNGESISINCDSNISKIKSYHLDNFFTVDGSPSNSTWHRIIEGKIVYNHNIRIMDTYLNKMQDSIGFSPLLVENTIKTKQRINQDFFHVLFDTTDNRDFLYKPAFAFGVIVESSFVVSGHSSELKTVYNTLDHKIRNSYYGKLLDSMARLSVGQSFPDFSLPSTDGKIISSRSITSKNKLTIIHFWSFNSRNKEKYQDELNRLYQKYHPMGFEVIGVYHTYDDPKTTELPVNKDKRWKELMTFEQSPWLNVADLNGDDGPVAKVYHEYAPNDTTNVLIDNDGRIIAWEVKGNILKYYLWKFFEKDKTEKARLAQK